MKLVKGVSSGIGAFGRTNAPMLVSVPRTPGMPYFAASMTLANCSTKLSMNTSDDGSLTCVGTETLGAGPMTSYVTRHFPSGSFFGTGKEYKTELLQRQKIRLTIQRDSEDENIRERYCELSAEVFQVCPICSRGISVDIEVTAPEAYNAG